MGTVFRAVDLRTGGNVAVKAPHAFLTRDRNYVERLRREAMIAASLQSPRIARVTDLAEHDGTPYLVMEYVPGETLANVIDREGPLAPERALRIALEVARALDAAHQRGIVHRDLKPQNIHVDNDDVKVLDFGIARLQGLSSLTGAGTLLGSPEYTAPERMDGMGDIRGDVYALGVVLYEMLSGRLPFSGDTPWRLLQRHASEPPPPLPAGLPTAVYPIVERCLAKRPEDRYATPRDLAVAPQHAARLVDGETGAATVAAPPPSSAQIRLPTPPDFAPRPANSAAGAGPTTHPGVRRGAPSGRPPTAQNAARPRRPWSAGAGRGRRGARTCTARRRRAGTTARHWRGRTVRRRRRDTARGPAHAGSRLPRRGRAGAGARAPGGQGGRDDAQGPDRR
ncbi:MAG: protein kinase [Dehalococcoidia bacterium]